MTNDEFCKITFRAFQTIYYKNGRVEDEFMLVGVDFHERILFLEVHDGSPYKAMYDDGAFPARIEHCFTDRQKAFKMITGGKKIILPQ
jgi:hypothetical protein